MTAVAGVALLLASIVVAATGEWWLAAYLFAGGAVLTWEPGDGGAG